MDEFLQNLKRKVISTSNIISKNEQINLMNSIKDIEVFKGNLDDSDISFIKKK